MELRPRLIPRVPCCRSSYTKLPPAKTSLSRTRMLRFDGHLGVWSLLVAVPVRAIPCELVTLRVMPFCCLMTEAIR